MVYYTPAQKRAYAVMMSKKRSTSYKKTSYKRKPVSSVKKQSLGDKIAYNYKNYKPKGTGASIGGVLGGLAGSLFGPTGTAIGSSLGASAGNFISKITGMGDYKIQYNSLMGNSQRLLSGDAVPAVQNTHTGVRICHREFIQDVSSTTAFQNLTFNINPGLASTFPWLSAVAQNFQQYKLHGMIFSFVSTSADALNSTNTALGTVIMATNYNASAPAFQSKSQMENNEFTTSSKPSNNILHMIECDPKQTLQEGKFYIRTGALPANQDIKTYDVGLFQFGTAGSQAAAVIGELHVSYDIELMKPVDASVLDNTSGYAHYQLTSPVAANPLATAQVKLIDNIGMTINAAGTVLTFPGTCSPGQQFLVCYIVYGTSTASIVVPSVTLNSCTQEPYWNANSATTANNTGTTASVMFVNYILQIGVNANSTNKATITLSTGGTLPAGTTTGDLFITQIPGNAI